MMPFDLALAIDALVPAAQYGGSTTANDRASYDALRWEDERPRPKWEDLEAASERVVSALAWAALRAERNARLAACDWTQLTDAAVDATAWADYRRTLRDLPETVTDPTDVTWPAPPA